MRMEEDQDHCIKKILDLTMEIIYLLTGEGYVIAKKASGEQLPYNYQHGTSLTSVPHPYVWKPEIKYKQKILEVTRKIAELLTGEVPIRCQDVTVYFSMEEWEYLEGHKDLYKDAMMENQPPLTSPDGSSNGNPPERCPCPLYSRDSTQEGYTIPHHHQDEKLKDIKAEIKEEEEEMSINGAQQSTGGGGPLYFQDSTQEDHTIPHHHQGKDLMNIKVEVKAEEKETYVMGDESIEKFEMMVPNKEKGSFNVMMENQPPLTSPDGSSNGNPPERCPRPLYSWDSPQEDHNYARFYQGGNPIDIKVEVKAEEEETYVRGDQSVEKGTTMPIKEDESFHAMKENQPPLTSPDGSSNENPPERCPRPLYSRDSTQEGHPIPHHHQHEELADVKFEIKEEEEETLVSSDHWPAEKVRMMESPKEEESSLDISTDGHHVWKSSEGLFISTPYRNAEDFVVQYSPVVHSITYNIHHRPDHLKQSMDPSNPKESSDKSHSVTPEIHLKSQSTDGSTNLSDPQESSLSHTGESLFSCTVCGNSFAELGELLLHQKTHIDKRSFSCSECGKIFSQERSLLRHHRVHTGAVAQRPNPEAASRLHERHFPDILQPTPTQRAPQRRCRVCSKRGMRRDTRYYCPSCPNHPGLCIKNCFRRYHTLVNY
ncbi:uncharacterized protein [Aquarana catesbeiana]|uniref:uncharacterized protein n=1 Tax=Aquarana catesbeiana TaxID=8400 RepID=UPI003CC9B165